MNSTLEEEKTEIRGLIENLFKKVTDALIQSMKAFEDLDAELAENIASNYEDAEKIYHRLEDMIYDTIATFQPKDIELRRLIAYVNTSNGLHSVGRFASKIGEIVTLCEGLDHFKELETLPYLAELANTALNISIRSVLDENLSEIDELEKLEAQSDSELVDMFQEIAEYLNKRHDISAIAMYYIIVGRYFERAADQAISISESAVYLVTGERKKLGLAYEGMDDLSDLVIDM
jgi:phosphate transport system protein